VKIATFNVNNINQRLPNLLGWLNSSRPDVVCLQEIKSSDEVFPVDAFAGGRHLAKAESADVLLSMTVLVSDS
jgi:exonuclease III